MKHGKVAHIWNHGEKLWLFQFPNPERINLIIFIIDLLLSQVAYVKLLKEWWVNVMFGIWKRMEENGLLAKQQCGYRLIDRLFIIQCALRHLFEMLLSEIKI